MKAGGKVTLENPAGAKVFNAQFGSIASVLGYLPDETVIDWEK